jgi:hypothetical protein
MEEPATETQTCLQWIAEDDALYLSCRQAAEALYSDDKGWTASEIRELLADRVKGRVTDRAYFRYRFRLSEFQETILSTISGADWLTIADRILIEADPGEDRPADWPLETSALLKRPA